MKIIQIMPGYLQSYYCENCLRDNNLVRALRQLGHDVLIVPLYMPAQFNTAQRQTEIFMGGINVYLQQHSSFFRHTPRWLDKLFDTPWLLKKVTQKQSMTRAQNLGGLTLSMLQGEDGHQRKELFRMVRWLKQHEQPDVICLSNALLLGLAPTLKQQLQVPIVCMLQDEEPFLEAMGEAYHQPIWEVMSQQSQSVDLFVANSDRYAQTMQHRLHLNSSQITYIHTSLCLDDYPENNKVPEVPTLGFLSRVTEEKGLDLLIEAYLQLQRTPELNHLRLKITGDQMTSSSRWHRQLQQRVKGCDVEFINKFDLENRLDFFSLLSILCVPNNQGESSGFNAIEAQAMSIPVVQPDNQEFPDLLKATPGGVLFQPNDKASLVNALHSLLTNPSLAQEIGKKGRQHIAQYFNMSHSAEKWIQKFQSIQGYNHGS